MPGGAALTGLVCRPWIRRSRHPAACDTHLNPYALPAIIHANKRFIYQTLSSSGLTTREGFFYTVFTFHDCQKEVISKEHFRSSIQKQPRYPMPAFSAFANELAPYESDADWVITGVPFDMATSGKAAAVMARR